MNADPTSQNTIESQQSGLNRIWERLRRLGLGDSAMRFMTTAITLVLILVVVGVVDAFNLPETELKPQHRRTPHRTNRVRRRSGICHGRPHFRWY